MCKKCPNKNDRTPTTYTDCITAFINVKSSSAATVEEHLFCVRCVHREFSVVDSFSFLILERFPYFRLVFVECIPADVGESRNLFVLERSSKVKRVFADYLFRFN